MRTTARILADQRTGFDGQASFEPRGIIDITTSPRELDTHYKGLHEGSCIEGVIGRMTEGPSDE